MLCDIHNHIGHGMTAEEIKQYFLQLKEENGVHRNCILSIPVSFSSKYYHLHDLFVLQVKDMLKPYTSAFMGFVHGEGAEDYLTQLKNGLDMGFEGLKVLETKPDVQKKFGIRMWDEKFDAAWDYIEENDIPVLMHVADPAESWDIEKVNKYALEHGRFYGLPGFLSREELYSDVEAILRKHPKLKLILAHFYFLSNELDRAVELFEKYPNVCFDLTPGKEMYENFGKDADKAREFFVKYADRLYLGTDVNDSAIPKYHGDLYQLILKSLAGGERFLWRDGYNCMPLSLPEEVQEKIKSGNFIKLLGETPKPVNYTAVRNEITRLEGISDILSDNDKQQLEAVKKYFAEK